MSDEKPEGAGTEPNPAVDSPEAGTTADPGQGNDANGNEKTVTITQHEYLTIKTARENEKRLQAELDAIRSGNGAPKPPTTATEKPETRVRNEAKLRAAAEAGNEDAQVLVDAIDEARAMGRSVRFEMEMAAIPEADRADVERIMKETGAPSPKLAQKLLRGERHEAQAETIARLERELAEAKKAAGQRREPPADTRIKGAGGAPPAAAGKQEEITTAEYNRRMAADPTGTLKARREKRFVLAD